MRVTYEVDQMLPVAAEAWNTFVTQYDVDSLPDALHREIGESRAQKCRENNNDGGGDAE